MATTKYRIECENNSVARNMSDIPGCKSVRHNGGKTVIALSDDVAATEAWLDASHKVRSYAAEEVAS